MNSSNAMKKGRFEAARLRGKDLNLRPLGYEPNELPLLHPAVQISIISPNRASSTAQKLSWNLRRYSYVRKREKFRCRQVGTHWERDRGRDCARSLVPVLKKRVMRATTILKKDHRMVSGLLMTLEMTPKFNGIVRKRLLHDRKAGLKTQIAA